MGTQERKTKNIYYIIKDMVEHCSLFSVMDKAVFSVKSTEAHIRQ